MVGFHPISTARKVLVWSKSMISSFIEYTIVLTFTIIFSIITRLKHLRPSTRDRLSAVINPQRSRRPIFPSFPSTSATRETPTSRPLLEQSSPQPPSLPAPEPQSPLPDHQFLSLTADDTLSETAVGSIIEPSDTTSYPFPPPTKSSEYKLKEAEHAAKLITARAQKLADGMLTSAAALHDTWVQDAHRQYHAIITKARLETEPLAVQLQELRRWIEEREDKGVQTDDDFLQAEKVEEEQKKPQNTFRFSTVQFVDNPPSVPASINHAVQVDESEISSQPLALPVLPNSRPVTPIRQTSTPPQASPQSSASASAGTRPSTSRPSTSYSERSPNSSPTRPRKLTKRPKSMEIVTPLASLSPAESAANTAMKRNSAGSGNKRGAVKGFMERTSSRLFSGGFSGGEKDGGGVLVNVARSTTGKKGKKEGK